MFLLCLKIFFARVFDVSLGTIRTVYIVRGNKFISTVIAFFEVLIWFFAARSALSTNIDNILIPISYALGYSFGTLIGMFFNDRFINGIFSIQVFSESKDLLEVLKDNNYGVTVLKTNSNYMFLIYLKKSRFNECIKIIKYIDPKAFIVVNDSKLALNGFFK